MQVNWYRNASEKDNDKVHGTGELLELVSPAKTSEAIAIIVSKDGQFVEKSLSLIKQADVQNNATFIELQSEINTLTSALEESENNLVDSLAEIEKLKKPAPIVKPAPKATTSAPKK